jgi:ATP-binding cassette, subfamily B, bacterial
VSRRPLLVRLAGALRPYAGAISAVLAVDLLATPVALLMPLPLKIAVDSVLGHKALPGFVRVVTPSWFLHSSFRVLVLAALLQVLVVLAGECQAVASYVLRARTGERITLDFRARIFRHVQRLSILLHDARGTADSVYRVQYDAPAFQWLTTDGLLPLVSSAVALGLTLLVVARLDIELCLVAITVTPLLYVLGREYNRRMRPRYRAVKGIESEAMRVVQEVLGALRVVKAFGREEREEQRFVRSSGRGAQARVRLALAEGIFGLLVNGTVAAGTAVVLFVGVRNVQDGVLTLGELLMVLSYLAQLYSPLKTISRQAAGLQTQIASAERAFEVLDERAEVPEAVNPLPIARAGGGIAFEDVSFSYDGEHSVLRHISFNVEPGASVGIAGRTGAGKTTLVNLMTRFFDPSEGAVRLDGIDLRWYRLADLRRQFAVVSQDPVLFSTSILENISYARPGATREEITAAARAASAHDFVVGLPDGYETLVGERGMRLSGGERQRIALARAFLKDAPILLLDEPTSAVDVTTEAAIMEATERLMAGRTTFMIAHRLSTLERCDIRLDLEDGRLAVRPPAAAGPEPPEPLIDLTPLSEAAARIDTAVEPFARFETLFEGELVVPSVVSRERNVYRSTHASELVTVRWPGGETERLFCKYGTALAGDPHEGRGHRGGVPYEAAVYRQVLGPLGVRTPRLRVPRTEDAAGVSWIVVDALPDAVRLYESPRDRLVEAAHWIGAFHREAERERVDRRATFLKRYDEAYYLTWIEQAYAAAAERRLAWLELLCDQAMHLMDAMLVAPATVIHGEFFPKNILCDGPAIYPVDWESAAVAPGEIDLATLTQGWDAQIVDAAEEAYLRARWPDGTPPHDWREALMAARLYAQFRWLDE